MELIFRHSMNGLHTWAGVLLGGLLFAIFWMGTLAVFDREIDQWMIPPIRLEERPTPLSFDTLYAAFPPGAVQQWSVLLPSARLPAVRLGWRDARQSRQLFLDATSLAELPPRVSLGASRFFYPFHYNLNLKFANLGGWLVGLAGMAMLVLCVSGVVVHRKIFADFFAIRTDRKSRRLLLDLHNVAGIVALPFHVGITLSGLVIAYAIYFPSGWQLPYQGDRSAFGREVFPAYVRAPAGRHGASASLDVLAAEARRLWQGGTPFFLRVWHPGDSASYVEFRRSYEDSVTMRLEVLYFDARSGELLDRFETQPVATIQRFVAGLHFIQFHHWPLRWVYFGLGLMGCVLIATGFLFWLESRRRKHEQQAPRGLPLVEGLAIGSVTGIVIATLAFFVANRLMPLGVTFAGYDRAALEVWTFYLSWLATFAHAWLRPRAAWREQCVIISALALLAVTLNWITTGDHLVRSLGNSHLWPIAGMDILLMAGAALAMLAVIRLRRAASIP
jgi:uncharacterized iron-regulated membrane protein